MSTVHRFFADERAATSIEYGLIAAGISIAIIAVVQGLGTKLTSTFTSVRNALKQPIATVRAQSLFDFRAVPSPAGRSFTNSVTMRSSTSCLASRLMIPVMASSACAQRHCSAVNASTLRAQSRTAFRSMRERPSAPRSSTPLEPDAENSRRPCLPRGPEEEQQIDDEMPRRRQRIGPRRIRGYRHRVVPHRRLREHRLTHEGVGHVEDEQDGIYGQAGYAAAKAALRTQSKSISKELGPKGVRVNSVSPGWIMTEATGDFLEMLRFANNGTIEDARQSVLDASGGISIGRGAQPEEVADLIAYLAPDRAAAIHGAEFVIDGGTIRAVQQ